MDDEAERSRTGEEPEPGVPGDVSAETVTINRGGARSVTAGNMVIRQGGALRATADHLELRQGGLGIGRAQTLNMTASAAQTLLVGGDAHLELSGARLLLARRDVTVNQGGAVIMASPRVKAENCGTIVLLAGQVEGTVNAIFDLSRGGARPALVGAVLGLLAGLALRGGKRRGRGRQQPGPG